MSRSAFIAAALLLAGCNSSPQDQAQASARGQARIELFKVCMELAAKMPRQADDDVSDIVQECSSQAAYMVYFPR